MSEFVGEILAMERLMAMLPDGDTIHTFRNPNGMLIGADWDRAEVLSAIEKHGVALSGEQATRMNHGLVVKDERGYLFIETKKVPEAIE